MPTSRPNAVVTCTDSSELVLLTPRYGARPPREGGVEAVLRDGRVAARCGARQRARCRATGCCSPAPATRPRFLRNAALPRSRAEIELTLTSRRAARSISPRRRLVVGAGPRLLRDGRVAVDRRGAEGFAPPQAPSFFGPSWPAATRARSRACAPDGTLLLVTVDGRRPGWSAGMTLPEAARLMRSLGARDAHQPRRRRLLDHDRPRRGGEPPLRPGGERPVSNGLFVLP